MAKILITFGGWFQVRLATDPDPSDEPRGISGMIHVFPGEPDLDRIIRLQPPAMQRTYCPTVGVSVKQVAIDGKPYPNHVLIGAKVNLLNDPVFKGENGIVAEDGSEPIVPFVFQIQGSDFLLQRPSDQTPGFVKFPYPELQAKEISRDPEGISKVTGIPDPVKYFAARAEALTKDLAATKDEFSREVMQRRITFLKSKPAPAFFPAFMRYEVPLGGDKILDDKNKLLASQIDPKSKWNVSMKFCAWDPDALTGYTYGTLAIG